VNRLIQLQLAYYRISQGRLIPLLLLALACITLYHIEVTPLAGMQAAQFDRYQRLMPRERTEQPVLVVEIDSRSLAKYGQWPWPRDQIAQLLMKIQAGKPLAVGLDMLFVEPDHYSPERLAIRFPNLPESAIANLPDPDFQLSLALASGPSVLAISGVTQHLPGTRQPQKPLPSLDQGAHAGANLTQYVSGLASLPMLETAASGEGLINTAPSSVSGRERGVLRSVPTLGLIGQQPFLSLPLEMTRIALGADGRVGVDQGQNGIARIRIGAYSLPTQANGEVLLHFGRANADNYLSAVDVLSGRIAPETFASRLVLVGLNAGGLQDRVISPLGENLPGIDIHVQVIESLLAGVALRRPGTLPLLEAIGLATSGLLLIALMPKMRPRHATALFAALALLWFAAGYASFHFSGLLLDPSAIVLLLTPIFITALSATWIVTDIQRRRAEHALHNSRFETARVNGELDAARRIHLGLVPDPASQFADESRFVVAALLEPARAVGGDFYDCFMLDEKRLCFAIADVAGKGLPASLFMAVSKTLIGALVRRNRDLGLAMREMEAELDRVNPEMQFVTLFVGVLDVVSGELEFVRAGHDAPLLLRAGNVDRIDAPAAAGPPLCVLGNYAYCAAKTRLQPGDQLCLFTDGASEASDGETQFGAHRLGETCLETLATAASLQEQIQTLRDAVRRFESGRAPMDDLTLMLLRWHGAATPGLSAR